MRASFMNLAKLISKLRESLQYVVILCALFSLMAIRFKIQAITPAFARSCTHTMSVAFPGNGISRYLRASHSIHRYPNFRITKNNSISSHIC